MLRTDGREESVASVAGVGRKTADALRKVGVFTVHDLAHMTEDQAKATGHQFDKHVQTARKLLAAEESSVADEPAAEAAPEAAGPLLLEGHTWYETGCEIPCPRGEDVVMRHAVVMELSVDAAHHVGMVCEWLENDEMCQRTYSPMLLRACNPPEQLPALELTADPQVLRRLPSWPAVEQVLHETRCLLAVLKGNVR